MMLMLKCVKNRESGRGKKNNSYSIIGYEYKIFKILVNGSINFELSHIFNNNNHFKDISGEYEVKYEYHLNRYIN